MKHEDVEVVVARSHEEYRMPLIGLVKLGVLGLERREDGRATGDTGGGGEKEPRFLRRDSSMKQILNSKSKYKFYVSNK